MEPEECKPTCRCKPGYVRDDNGICILEEQCPCYHNSKAVPEGHVIKTSACETWSVKFTFVYLYLESVHLFLLNHLIIADVEMHFHSIFGGYI